jgi:uncharacterized protein (TIGR03067 family)
VLQPGRELIRPGTLPFFRRCTVVRIILLVMTVGCFGLLLTATAQEEKGKSKGLEELRGVWNAESLEIGGKKLGDDDLKQLKMQLVFTGDKYAERLGGKVNEEGTVKVDTSKKPATIDLNILTGNDKDKLQIGIYEVKGDTMKLCLAFPGAKDRPKTFASPEGEMFSYVVFKRGKE